ncbi:hypothetical protein RCL_jg2624.t1 [Rhizophagus clarus]|uniref:Uncharacterized protein n=1 Tax=Rhizophagus clarus TaxID=94130 RepID=A0A8H3LMK0_9GLOM|nr:hypothetical protein RCL_jg2624.t1 [Rhizophagus clarus]
MIVLTCDIGTRPPRGKQKMDFRNRDDVTSRGEIGKRPKKAANTVLGFEIIQGKLGVRTREPVGSLYRILNKSRVYFKMT